MVVLVPAAGVIDTLRRGAAAGARSATVFSAGFGEGFDSEAAALGRELAAVIAQTGLGVSGPNCMGNVCAKSRLVTLTEDRPLAVRPGPVALVGQSGGMMIFTNQALQERGIWPEYLITSGNEAGLSIADYIAFFADQPELKVIIIYVEAISQLAKFKAACRMARAANKSIVAVKLGQSEGGRSAAMAHTGSLAGSVEAFDAIAGEVGVIRADTLDDAVEITELLVHTGAAAAAAGSAPSRSPARIAAFCSIRRSATGCNSPRSRRRRPSGSMPCSRSDRWSPIRSTAVIGVLSSADNFMASIDALQADPNVDMVLVQEGLPRAARLRSRRALHSPRRRLRRDQGDEADRVRHADLARPDRLQPRAAREGPPRIVSAGGLQGLARDRERRTPRRARAPGARRDPRAASAGAGTRTL